MDLPKVNAGEDSGFIELNGSGAPPQISILMPLYRQRDLVDEAVSSVLAQTGVVAEIILSDDCSGDGTGEAAKDCVLAAKRRGKLPHRVLFRLGKERLWRDHLPLLADKASCDLLCQSHGDDVSLPHRAAAILRAAQSAPDPAMFVSRFGILGRDEADERPSGSAGTRYHRLIPETVILGRPYLMGCVQAWRKSRLAQFGKLDTSKAAESHDMIMAYRSMLAGGVMLIEEKLLLKRIHDESASQRLFAGEHRRLGLMMSALGRLALMKADTALALENGGIDDAEYGKLLSQLRDFEAGVISALVKEHQVNTRQGKHPVWQISGF